jgi:hypothetical protein
MVMDADHGARVVLRPTTDRLVFLTAASLVTIAPLTGRVQPGRRQDRPSLAGGLLSQGLGHAGRRREGDQREPARQVGQDRS